jgi:hypothetical protein
MREPEHTIMTRLGKAVDAAMSAAAWSTTGTLFSAVRRIYESVKAILARTPEAGTIATATDIASAGILRRTVAGKALESITTADLFAITGGPVKLLGFVGLITTVIEAKANATKIQFTPTGGAATDLCAVLDVTGSAAKKFFTITGTKANAMALSADVGIVVANLASPVVLSTGTISMNCADTSTGGITWFMLYEPMDPGAAVAAA